MQIRHSAMIPNTALHDDRQKRFWKLGLFALLFFIGLHLPLCYYHRRLEISMRRGTQVYDCEAGREDSHLITFILYRRNHTRKRTKYVRELQEKWLYRLKRDDFSRSICDMLLSVRLLCACAMRPLRCLVSRRGLFFFQPPSRAVLPEGRKGHVS